MSQPLMSAPASATRRSRSVTSTMFTHVMKDVLDIEDDEEVMVTCKERRIKDVEELLGYSEDYLRNFSCKTSDGKEITITMGQYQKIRAYNLYLDYKTSEGEELHENHLLATYEDFWSFRRSRKANHLLRGIASITPRPNSPTRRQATPAQLFRKSIKRDPSLFHTLKERGNWDNWKRNIVTTARAQDVDDILDSNYTPMTPEDTDLFEEKQKCMYSVFEKTLQTDHGKAFVREHTDDYDAQEVFKKISKHYKESMAASLEASNLLSYITTTKIDNVTWKGTTEAFILHWKEQMRLYESLVPVCERFSCNQKKSLLESAVQPVKALRAIKDQADQLKIHNKKSLSYDEYSDLVEAAAANFDTKFKSNTRRTSRTVYQQEIFDNNDTDSDTEYDIDLPISTIQANFTKTNKERFPSESFLPAEK